MTNFASVYCWSPAQKKKEEGMHYNIKKAQTYNLFFGPNDI